MFEGTTRAQSWVLHDRTAPPGRLHAHVATGDTLAQVKAEADDILARERKTGGRS
jgi:hypothetical protein